MELYFTDSANINLSKATFDTFETRHILKTMRNKLGDSIHFTDGEGRLFTGRIISTNPTLTVEHEILEQGIFPLPSVAMLGIGFIRHSRMDFMIEKIVELGINRIFLFASRFTNFFTNNSTRWKKITRQAMKQSNRLYLPEIEIISDYKKFLKSISGVKHKFLADQTSTNLVSDVIAKSKINKNEDIVFVVGPEGGFHAEELIVARESGLLPISFGDKRLRTETAAISAASYINLLRN